MPARNQLDGSQIIDYKGDANLALGGGAGLNVYGDTDASGITATARELALQAHGDNVMLWRQRIDDRNKMQKMVDDDQVPLENILEQNRPYVEGKINDARDFYYKNVNKIVDDPAAYREYKNKLQDAKDAAKQANTNYLLYSAEQKQLGTTTNSIEADNRKKFLSTQLEKIRTNPNAYIDPYVPIGDADLSVVAAAPVYGAETQRQEGDYIVKESKVDAGKTLDAYRKNFMLEKNYDGFVKYVSRFKQNPDMVDQVNAKLADVNKQLGLEGDAAIQPIDFTKDKTPDVAAKIALADNPPVTTKKEYAKEQINDQIDKARLGIEAQKARNEAAYQRAEIGLGYARIAQDDKELKQKKDQWAATQKGGDTTKNAAFEFANRLYGDMVKLSDANGVITPDKLRQMNSEQLKYLGVEDAGSLNGLKLQGTEALQLLNGQVRVLKNAQPLPDGSGRWGGEWDQNSSTNVYNIATNRLNEENKNAGSKEINSYMPVDTGTGGISETTTGASTTVRGGGSTSAGSSSKTPVYKATYTLPNGQPISIEELKKSYPEEKIKKYIEQGIIK